MRKRIVALFLTLALMCSCVPFGALAADASCDHNFDGNGITIDTSSWDGFPVPITVSGYKCTKDCGLYKFTFSVFGIGGQVIMENDSAKLEQYLLKWVSDMFGKNATATKFTSGGGSTDGSGVGRNPKGYGDEGKANVNCNGKEILWVEPFGISSDLHFGFLSSVPTDLIAGSSSSGTHYFNTNYATAVYYFVAPVSGLYYLGSAGSPYDFGVFNYFRADTWESINIGASFSNAYQMSCSLNKGDKRYYLFNFSNRSLSYAISYCPYKFNLNKIPIFIEPLGDSSITTTNNITINNNTWNGNIYTDNSTNLTYIYPQYTTVNEKNETVTNISNTPIIYNNETKQYYTYDQTTKNYYYITYNENPTTPTPSPSPTPDPDNPSVTPTPTPTPGGDTGDTTGILAVLVEIRDNMIQGFLDIKAAFVAGFAELSANFTLAIENLNLNITNIFNKKFPDKSTPETATPSPSPSPSPSPAPLDPILPETQNLIIPKMNSNTFTDEHGTWIASGSSKYSDVFDFFHAFDRSTSDFWETNASPSYLQIEIPDPQNYYVDGYIMRISKFTNRYAKEWTLQGSDDGKTWDDLDTQKGQNLSDLEEHKYPLTLRKAYKYYRLNMSNYASSMCSLSHFNLLGYDAKDVVTPTPAPTNPPSPSPAPDPGTDPTPVPTPGGDSGGNNSSSGDSSLNPFKWLTDLLKNIVEGILKAIWKLITALFGFLLWLLSLVGSLFPFIPGQAVLAVTSAVVIVAVIRIIKFITGR